MKNKKTVVETEDEKKSRELVEKIANNISNLAKSVASLINGPLNKKALIILLSNSSGQAQYQVEKILNALVDMEKDWLNKTNKKTSAKAESEVIKINSVAVVTIKNLGDFTPQGAKDVSAWLMKVASDVKKNYKLWDKKGRSQFKYLIK